jgi:hypothetical protein
VVATEIDLSLIAAMKGKSQTIADIIWQNKISSNQKSCDYSNESAKMKPREKL